MNQPIALSGVLTPITVRATPDLPAPCQKMHWYIYMPTFLLHTLNHPTFQCPAPHNAVQFFLLIITASNNKNKFYFMQDIRQKLDLILLYFEICFLIHDDIVTAGLLFKLFAIFVYCRVNNLLFIQDSLKVMGLEITCLLASILFWKTVVSPQLFSS